MFEKSEKTASINVNLKINIYLNHIVIFELLKKGKNVGCRTTSS